MANEVTKLMDIYNSKEDAPSFVTEDEALDWAESLNMSKYGVCFCYIDGVYTCIECCGQVEDAYRSPIESIIEDYLTACGIDQREAEEVAIDLGAEMTTLMFERLSDWSIMERLQLYDTF